MRKTLILQGIGSCWIIFFVHNEVNKQLNFMEINKQITDIPSSDTANYGIFTKY